MDVKVMVCFFLCMIVQYGTGEDEIPTSIPNREYVWEPYPKEVYPLVRNAFKDIASSDSKIAIFFHYFNGPVIPGLEYTGELNYSYVPEGGYDFYYDWSSTKPADESLYSTEKDQSAGEYAIVTDQSADESLYSTITDQSADESLYSTITDQSANEYVTVTEQVTEESLHTIVEDQSSDESTATEQSARASLYSTVTDQSTDEYLIVAEHVDESLHTIVEDKFTDESAVTDQSADEYVIMTDQVVDESLHTIVDDESADESTVTEQSADESLYSTLTDQFVDKYVAVTDQVVDESLHTIVNDQSAYESTITDQFADEYVTVTDESADESTIMDESTDESLYSTLTDQSADESTTVVQSADESLYSTLTDQSADESITGDQSVDEALDSTAEAYTVPNYLDAILVDRVGLEFEEREDVEESRGSNENYSWQVIIPGIPGQNYPVFYNIPKTSFTCSDKEYIPGIYADTRTGCQVFHVCFDHMRESFLCPVGTTFNQALLACDRWYTSDCSLAPQFYDVNARGRKGKHSTALTSHIIDGLVEHSRYLPLFPNYRPVSKDPSTLQGINWSRMIRYTPVKAKVLIYPESTTSKARDSEDRPQTHSGQEYDETDEEEDYLYSDWDGEATVESVEEMDYLNMDDVFQDIETPKKAGSVLGKNRKSANVPQIVARSKRSAPRQKIESTVENISPATPTHPAKVFGAKPSSKAKRDFVPDIIMRALETAGSVIEKDILPLTREVVESSVKLHKHKNY